MSATNEGGVAKARSVGRRIAEMPRLRLAAIVLGFPVGLALGAWYRFLEHATPTSFIAPTVSVIVVGGIILGILALTSVVLRIPRVTRPLGQAASTAAVALVVGLPFGYLIGPTYQLSQELAGSLELELTGATTGSYSGETTCQTYENSDVLRSLDSGVIGAVGSTPLTAHVFWTGDPGEGVIQLVLEGGSDVSGLMQIQEVDADRWTGRASFSGLIVDDLDPDPDAGWTTAEGTVRWACARPPSQ